MYAIKIAFFARSGEFQMRKWRGKTTEIYRSRLSATTM